MDYKEYIDISFFKRTYVSTQNDVLRAETIEKKQIPEYLDAQVFGPSGYSVEWVLINKSCKDCG